MRAWTRLLLLAGLGVPPACSIADATAIAVSGACTTDRDCPAGLDCRASLCRPPPSTLLVDAEVRPPNRSGVPSLFIGVEVPAVGPWSLNLAESVVHETVVLGPSGAPIEADIVFRPANAGGDRALEIAFRVTPGRPALIPLAPGRYDVQISPVGADLPPLEVQDVVVHQGEGPRPKEFVLPPRYRRLTGSVRARYANARRLGGVEVWAIGMETGLASTLARSAADGAYSIELPESRDTTFRLHASVPPELEPSWDFEQVVRVPLDEDREKSIDIDLPSDALRGAVALEVIGVGLRGPVPVADALVTLTATASSEVDTRVFRVVGRTDDEGRLRVGETTTIPVLRGRYRALVEPPVQSDFARFDGSLDLGAAGNQVTVDQQLTLAPRTRASGRIVDATGAPVAFARVAFEPLADGSRAPDVDTDPTGSFVVELDPAPYVVLVVPREGGSPRRQAATAVAIEVPVEPTVNLEDIVLEEGRTVEGVVSSGPNALPVPDAEVTVFANRAGLRYPITRTRTDQAGGFAVVIPDR